MNRKEITKLITKTLIYSKLSDRKYYAREVTLDYGTKHPKRIDVMQYIPSGVTYASDIERGEFICYEIKSSYEDLYSGHGLNFYGDKNYIVTTMELGNRIYEDLDSGKLIDYIKEHYPESSLNFGVMVMIPARINPLNTEELYQEKIDPTPLDACDQWRITTLKYCHKGNRKRGVIELLFCMLRSKHNVTNREEV